MTALDAAEMRKIDVGMKLGEARDFERETGQVIETAELIKTAANCDAVIELLTSRSGSGGSLP